MVTEKCKQGKKQKSERRKEGVENVLSLELFLIEITTTTNKTLQGNLEP